MMKMKMKMKIILIFINKSNYSNNNYNKKMVRKKIKQLMNHKNFKKIFMDQLQKKKKKKIFQKAIYK